MQRPIIKDELQGEFVYLDKFINGAVEENILKLFEWSLENTFDIYKIKKTKKAFQGVITF